MRRIDFQITHLSHPPREFTRPYDSMWQILKPSASFLPERSKGGTISLFSPFVRGEISRIKKSVEWLQEIHVPPCFNYPPSSWDCVEATASVTLADPWQIIKAFECRIPPEEIPKWQEGFAEVLAFRLAALNPQMGGMYPSGGHGLLHWIEGEDPTAEQFVHVIRVQIRPLLYVPTPSEVAQITRRCWREKRF